jgi:branched-chain amino acid transport system ATP-binding protein
MPLFEATGISVAFGAVQAVNGVSLDLEPGEIAGLIGPNGAGKTTFIDAVTGYVRSSGLVMLDGHRLHDLPPHKRARAGLARTWQNAELFDQLSVLDNVRLATERLTPGYVLRSLVWRRPEPPSEHVQSVIERLGIDAFADAAPSELSAGQRKLVGLARALASDAKIILMDEPAAGLDNRETSALRTQLLEVARHGVGILLIEHDMELVLSTCHTLHVLDRGSLIAAGDADEVRRNPTVIQAYLGMGAEGGTTNNPQAGDVETRGGGVSDKPAGTSQESVSQPVPEMELS